MMKLTLEQIKKLYQFTRQHYVEYYDLQTELVDHLANGIEEIWTENPKISFEEALQREFKKFGVFGFMDVIEKRTAAMNKRYNKLIWKHLKEYFKLPQIIGTLTAIGILFYLLKLSTQSVFILSIIGMACLVILFVSVYLMIQKNKKRSQQTGKKWLLKEIISGHSSSLGLVQLPMHFLINLDENMSELWLFILSIIFVLLIICEYIILFEIPAKAEEYLKQTYPEYSSSD